MAEQRLKDMECAFDTSGSDQDLIRLNHAQAEHLRALADEESFWKQRARVKWLHDGDRNTKFFHASTVEKRSRLRITRIKDDAGHWLEEASQISQHAVDFFHNLLTQHSANVDKATFGPFLDSIPSLITLEDNQALLRPVSMDEVRHAVFSMDPDSSPGCDGYPGSFYRHCWDIISTDVFMAVQEFFVGVPLPRIISSTLIVLLPKKQSPNTFADFRPISLCNFINKVFTRLLCDRLSAVLPKLISEEQSAFLKGREISDNILLAQEVVSHLHRRTRGHNLIFKMDMVKAFDRVSWPFLRRLLLAFGFDPHLVAIIMGNLSRSWFSILLNGATAGFFQSSCGLKQGDPLSPLLFIMLSEVLSRGLKTLLHANKIATYALPRNAPVLTHLCFADDLIIFTKGLRRSLSALFNFLHSYEQVTGQLISKMKSSFYVSRRCSTAHIRLISQLTGIQKSELPFGYLGATLFHGRRKSVYFQPLVQKISSKLLGWKKKMLSPGGRLILIRHVLQAIPTHLLAAMHPTTAVIHQIDRFCSGFIWGSTVDQPRRIWRRWEALAFPVLENGVGVRRLQDIHAAFSCKLLWKIRTQRGLWASYVNHVSVSHSCMRSRLQAVQDLVDDNICVRIGAGDYLFWTSNWLGTGCLSRFSPSPSVPDLVLNAAFHNEEWQVHLFADELPAAALTEVLRTKLLFVPIADCLVWKCAPAGSFTVSSAYDLVRQRQPELSVFRHLWRPEVPLRISIFGWKLLNGLLPFGDVLHSLGVQMPTRCPFCEHADTIPHAFLYCPQAAALWFYFAAFFRLQLPPPGAGLWAVMVAFWEDTGPVSTVLRLLPLLIVWSLWKARTSMLHAL